METQRDEKNRIECTHGNKNPNYFLTEATKKSTTTHDAYLWN